MTVDPEPSLLLSRPAAARLLGVGSKTVGLLISQGILTTVRLHPKGHPMLRRADVEALAATVVLSSRPVEYDPLRLDVIERNLLNGPPEQQTVPARGRL